MDLSYGSEYGVFRQQVRDFIEANRDQAPAAGARGPAGLAWQKLLIDNGYHSRTVPKAYGGYGAAPDILASRIIAEEFSAAQLSTGLGGQGISMLTPMLLEMGSEAQKLQFIQPTILGEMVWCQGYSEPGAGSDLASLTTKAELDGDEWVINGQKIWTSTAQSADWIFCLVRTDFEVPKHSGISFILFDMRSKGVTTKPIKLISGNSVFCETFFDDVRVPARNVVGKLNDGWAIAKRLLQHERTMISGFGLGGGRAARGSQNTGLDAVAMTYRGDKGRLSDPVLRDQIAQHRIDSEAFAFTSQRSAQEAKQSRGPNATSSMLKNYGCELNKRRYELLLRAMGTQALGWESVNPEDFGPQELAAARDWLRSKGNSIEGGTYEVQLNVIAKRVLGLPDMTSMLAKQEN